MDRFSWSDGALVADEQLVVQQNGVRLYDGQNKTAFDHGRLLLTNLRLIWKDHKNQTSILTMALSYILSVDEEAATFTKSSKIVVQLSPVLPDKNPGPVASSPYTYVRFSFTEGGQKEFLHYLVEQLRRKSWELKPVQPTHAQKQIRTGISGIQQNLQQKSQQVDQNISQAFEDLSQLMEKAKDMVALSKNISAKIKDKQGDITENETLQFKSYLLSLGIDDPVTRETHGTGDTYLRELAKQISDVMEQPLKECGGLMTLTDVYCRINRARGMELLSPDDLINACNLMDKLNLPVRVRRFDSGVLVLQLKSHSEEVVIQQTQTAVEKSGSLTAEELSKLINLSVVLSRERLLIAEQAGKLCRDESIEGLRFYPNRFLLTT